MILSAISYCSKEVNKGNPKNINIEVTAVIVVVVIIKEAYHCLIDSGNYYSM
jgi:hypothetical protein